MKKINLLVTAALLTLIVSACQSTVVNSIPVASSTALLTPKTISVSTPSQTSTPAITTTPTDIWQALLVHTPVPWTTPLPPEESTILDATYVKVNPREATPFPCARCPDYALEGGVWKLQLDKGIFRIYHALSTWRSLGSYTVSEDRLYLFNDPYCNRETGIYKWTMEDGVLIFTEVDDPCSQGLRAANLIDQPWLSCRPPNPEAMITDHWQKPHGCDPNKQ